MIPLSGVGVGVGSACKRLHCGNTIDIEVTWLSHELFIDINFKNINMSNTGVQ
jgi:hypothetical protein